MNNEGDELTEITLDHKLVGQLPFKRCLQFLYTGVVDLNKDSELLSETISVAQTFNLPELQMICENAKKGDEFLNPSIGTWLNDRNSAISKELFLSKQLFSDVRFRVEGEKVYAHRLVLCMRCDVMSAMLTGGFKESGIAEVTDPVRLFSLYLRFNDGEKSQTFTKCEVWWFFKSGCVLLSKAAITATVAQLS